MAARMNALVSRTLIPLCLPTANGVRALANAPGYLMSTGRGGTSSFMITLPLPSVRTVCPWQVHAHLWRAEHILLPVAEVPAFRLGADVAREGGVRAVDDRALGRDELVRQPVINDDLPAVVAEAREVRVVRADDCAVLFHRLSPERF